MAKMFNAKVQLLVTITFTLTAFGFFFVISFFMTGQNLDPTLIERSYFIISRIILSIAFYGMVGLPIVYGLNNYVSEHYDFRRLAIQMSSIIFISILVSLLMHHFLPEVPFPASTTFSNPIIRTTGMNTLIGFIVISAYEVLSNIHKNNELQLSISQLEKDRLSLQLSALQQKMNPHFMFNSLNVLSELVHEDSAKADHFIAQFSKVYRYVLELENESFIALGRELEFFESYLYLLKIRFDDNLITNVKIKEEDQFKKIPVLSLQLLMENTIKHNKILKESPLEISLSTNGHYLTLENNKQLKPAVNESHGIGLSKIVQTYALLGFEKPEIIDGKDSFIVRLPLIADKLETI